MRVLIVGLPKSGTTILTYRVAAGLDGAAIEFEPTDGPDPTLAAGSASLVTKKLVGSQTTDLEAFGGYERRIWICRDPRDFLVSQTLYRWHRDHPAGPDDEARFEQALARLVAKEADPRSVSFLDLEPADYAATFDAVAGLWEREQERAADAADAGWFLFRYEDMVAGRYDDLDRYLGFSVEPEARVGAGLERVVRHKASGDWRHWFTDGDVAHYRAGSLRRYMDTFGYDHDDWVLEPGPSIDPAHASVYVTALFNEHRVGAAVERPPPPPHRADRRRLVLRFLRR